MRPVRIWQSISSDPAMLGTVLQIWEYVMAFPLTKTISHIAVDTGMLHRYSGRMSASSIDE